MSTPQTDSYPDPRPGWTIQSSPKMVVIVAILSMVAILAAWFNGLPLAVRLLLVLAALIYAGFQLHALLAPRYRRIGVDSSGLALTDVDGHSVDLAVQGRPFVSPLFIGLVARRRDNRRLVLLGLFRDQLGEDEYRRLAAWLRAEPGR